MKNFLFTKNSIKKDKIFKKFKRVSNLANKITIARIILIPLFIIPLIISFPYNNFVAVAIFSLLALSDLFDGYVARKYNEITKLGSLLDPLADKLLISAALIFLIGRGVDAWMAYVIIAREFIITGVRMLALMKNKIISAKFSGKLKMIFQIIAILAVMLTIPYAYILMLLATIITLYSGIEYVWIERELFKDSF
jgi:CDP-diacylglycerol--glycerol-3-phosphate 3-phosphatidyltransferase